MNHESAVLLSNHRSLVDHIVMAHLARVANASLDDNSVTLPRLNFYSWFHVWQVPTWRILFNIAKCDENWELDPTLAKRIFKKLLRSKFPEWVVLFPEVNIWSKESAELHREQSVNYYLPVFKNLLYPRFLGLYNVVTAFDKDNSKFTRMYDITIRYGEIEGPSLMEVFTTATPLQIKVHVKAKLFSRIPTKRDKLEKYLERVWVAKEKYLTKCEKQEYNPDSPQVSILTNRWGLQNSIFNSSRFGPTDIGSIYDAADSVNAVTPESVDSILGSTDSLIYT